MDDKMTDAARDAYNDYMRQWRAENRDKLREYQREYRRKNEKKLKRYRAEYWQRKAVNGEYGCGISRERNTENDANTTTN